MKNFLIIALLAVLSPDAFAGTRDLREFNTLNKIGVASEQFMSHIHIGLDNIDCSYTHATGASECHFTDISANDGNGADVMLTGRKAALLFRLLTSHGPVIDIGSGVAFVVAAQVRCTQAVPGVAEETPAQRTSCSFMIGGE